MGGTVRLPSAPWAAFDAAKHDIFRVEHDRDGRWWVEEKVTASGYCATPIWAPDDADLEHFEDSVLAEFAPLQVSGEGMFGIVVLNVPPTADLPRVQQLLRDDKRAGRWTVDELCVTAAWQAAAPQ
ncbi:DUF4265 domain-containing protein [Micromonospora sp. NPDC005252]|uniref:DUF4265 domain-containing protein n=1 Tax=Micromonospora sp. NPDC005252 TaxID=3364228 RepID=UPI0036A4CEFB